MEEVTDRHTDELEETEEIHIDVTEDGLVCMQGDDWELFLNPEEARLIGQALLDAAQDAEEGGE